MSRHLNIRISGKVQGVFFRASSKEIADSLGLFGFVQNEKDQSVYIEAEGDQEKLDQFVKWCRQGPPRAVVSNVNVADGTVVGFSSFDIRR
jgi:acylphosphatase